MTKIKKLSALKKKDRTNFQKDVTAVSLPCIFFMMLSLIIAYIGLFLGFDTRHQEYFGICYLLYCAITIGIIYLTNKDYVLDRLTPREKPTLKAFGAGLTSLIAMMVWFTIPVVLLDMLLGTFGFTLENLAPANSASDGITEFIYVAIIGPICEEIIFRGFVQRRLEKYSPVVAIVTSAIMFGLFHGNFGQLFPMIGTGLVFGYMAYKYSIKMSIAIHVTYNLVMGELFGMLTDFLEKGGEEFLLPIIEMSPFTAVMMVMASIGVVVIAKKALTGTFPLNEYRWKLKNLLYSFTSSGMMIFFTTAFCMCVHFIEKLP